MNDGAAKRICNNSPYVMYFGDSKRQFLLGNEPFDATKENSIGVSPSTRFTFIVTPGYIPEIYELASADAKKMMYAWMKFVCQSATTFEFNQDVTISVSSPEMKNTFTKIFSTGRQEGGPEELTMTVPYDPKNFFVTKTLKHWLGAIADPYSVAAHYNDTGISFNMWSSGCGFRYFKPDQSYQTLEYSALLANCIPKGYQGTQFNGDASATDISPLTITMTCSVLDDTIDKVYDSNLKAFANYRDYAVLAHQSFGSSKGTTLDAPNNFADDIKAIYG